jgi:hypothetical protein
MTAYRFVAGSSEAPVYPWGVHLLGNVVIAGHAINTTLLSVVLAILLGWICVYLIYKIARRARPGCLRAPVVVRPADPAGHQRALEEQPACHRRRGVRLARRARLPHPLRHSATSLTGTGDYHDVVDTVSELDLIARRADAPWTGRRMVGGAAG